MSKSKGTTKEGAVKEIVDTAVGVWLGTLLGKMGKGARKRIFRWRRALAPLWFGGFVWLACVIFRWQIPAWWPILLLIPVGGLLLAWFGPKITERWSRVMMALVPTGLDRGRDGVLDRWQERVYFGALTSYLGTYILLRVIDGPSAASGWIWMIGEVIFGGSWWFHRRIRTVGRADKFARKWHRLSDKDLCMKASPRLTPLIGSKVLDARAFGRTSVLKVRLAEGHTVDSVHHLKDALASFFDMRPNSVFIAPDEDLARNVIMTFLPKDPWKGKIPHPVIVNGHKQGDISLREMGKRFTMGDYAHGEPITYMLQHTLLCGSNGSGKSAWLHSLLAWLVPCNDVVLLGIDMASGATLKIWRRALALPLADDVYGALLILKGVLGVIRDREVHLGLKSEDDDDATDSFEPSIKNPWLVLIIDEFPDLLAEAKSTKTEDGGNLEKEVINILGRIAKKARKCGVRLIIASQNGTKVDLGSKEMQGQLKATVGLGLDAQQSRNLWGSLMNQGWSSTNLREGQFLIRDDDHGKPDPAKGYWVEIKERRQIVENSLGPSGKRAVYLEPTAWSVLMGETDADILDGETVEETVTGPEYAVLEYLRVEAPEGARVETISDVLTKAKEEAGGSGPGTSRATIYRHLEKLEKMGGLVIRNGGGEGVWKAAPVTPTAPLPRAETDGPVQIASIQGEQMSQQS